MRRLKEGFYNVMKLADAVKAKGKDAKKEIIEFSVNNKIEKPVTEAIIRFKTSHVENEESNKERPKIESRPNMAAPEDIFIGEEEKSGPAAKGKKKKKATSGMSGAAALFKKKLELKLGAGEGNGDID